MVAAQARGCSPIVKAFEAGRLEISREEAPRTIAHAIENPLPPSGNEVLRILRKEEGLAVSVTEASILEAQRTLAMEGFFVQPASAVGYAAVLKLAEAGTIKEEDRVVVVLTGSGLKYTAALDRHTLEEETCALENLGDHLLQYRGL
jgi:threonine synthase